MESKPGVKQDSQTNQARRMALVTLSAGCLTFIVAGLALGVGFVLDTRLETFPRWTLILLAASAPFTLGGVYLIVRRALRKMKSGEQGVALDGGEQ